MIRGLFLALGMASLGVGIVGIFVPLLPTTPLVLLAAFCFSRSSDRMHRWLLEHPRLGPPIRDWRRHRVIPARAKLLASAMIGLVIARTVVSGDRAPAFKVLVAAGLGAVIVYICSRPSRVSR